MSVLPMSIAALFLAEIGISPVITPAEFDRAGREMERHWAAGGSARAFTARYAARRDPYAARRALERRYLPCP